MRLEFGAESGAITFKALSNGDDSFSLDDLVLRGDAVALKGGVPIRTWKFGVVGDLSGTIGEEGIKAKMPEADVEVGMPEDTMHKVEMDDLDVTLEQEVATFGVGPGKFKEEGITIDFDRVTGKGQLGQPGDSPTSLGGLTLNDGNYSGGLPIVRLSEIELTKATMVIDDLSKWIGAPELEQLDDRQLTQLADAMTGTAEFTIVLKGAMPNPWASVTINSGNHDDAGKVTGYYTWSLIGRGGFDLSGRLLASSEAGGAVDILYDFDSTPLSGTAKWPPKQPIDLQLVGKKWYVPSIATGSKEISAYTDIKFNLKLDTTSVPLPANGVLWVQPDPGKRIGLTGEPCANDAKRLCIKITGLDPVAVRALVWSMFDVEASGIEIKEGVDLQVEYEGLIVKKVSGENVSGTIKRLDIAVIP